jgi:hypothetical protein
MVRRLSSGRCGVASLGAEAAAIPVIYHDGHEGHEVRDAAKPQRLLTAGARDATAEIGPFVSFVNFVVNQISAVISPAA